MTAPTAPGAPPSARPARWGLRVAYVACTAVLVLLVLVQAAMAGRWVAGMDDIALHGYVGNASFTVGLVGAVLAAVARVPRWQLALAAVVLAALFAQTGLGYVGRESDAAVSLHVPLGVAIFGLATVQLAAAVPLVRGER